jgi:VanZ family protein
MATILWFSSGDFSADQTSSFLLPLLRWLAPWATDAQLQVAHRGIRHTAHAVEYAILAALWLRALSRSGALRARAAGGLAVVIAVAWACVDEWHQSTIPSRTGSIWDVLLDGTGAAAAVLVILVVRRSR